MTAPKPDSWVDAGAASVKRVVEENARLKAAARKLCERLRKVEWASGGPERWADELAALERELEGGPGGPKLKFCPMHGTKGECNCEG